MSRKLEDIGWASLWAYCSLAFEEYTSAGGLLLAFCGHLLWLLWTSLPGKSFKVTLTLETHWYEVVVYTLHSSLSYRVDEAVDLIHD